MNKATKGTIAAGAAVLLLLGTGGSLAYWNSTADLGGQTISAGQLKVEQTSSAWTLQHTTGPAAPVTITDVKIVPGDTLTYTGEFDITAEGQNLAYTVTLANGSIEGATAAAADVKLAEVLNDSASFAVNGTAVNGASVTVDEPGTKSVTVTVTIEWPFGDSNSPAADNVAQLGKVTMDDFAVQLQQVDASL